MEEYRPKYKNNRYQWPWKRMNIGDTIIIVGSVAVVRYAAAGANSHARADGSVHMKTRHLGRGPDGLYRVEVRCLSLEDFIAEHNLRVRPPK